MDLKPIEKLKPFQKFCMTIGELPVSYLESMTYLEMVMWFLNFLQEKVIPTVNNNAEAVEELQTLFVQLHDYVENYFNNLDVQEEINNKLDEMVEDGTFDSILRKYYIKSVIVYNTINDLKEDENIIPGITCKTLGNSLKNDGAGSYYITRLKTENDVEDNFNIIFISNNLVAELLKNIYAFCEINEKTFKTLDEDLILRNTYFIGHGNVFVIEGEANNIKFENCIFDDFNFQIYPQSNYEFINCVFKNCSTSCIHISGNNSIFNIKNCKFIDTRPDKQEWNENINSVRFWKYNPINIFSNNNKLFINDCLFSNIMAGHFIYSPDTTENNYIEINNCTFKDVEGNGIAFQSATDGKISNNVFQNIGSLRDTEDYSAPKQNKGVGCNAIFCPQTNNMCVVNNRIINCVENAIEGRFEEITGNYIENTGYKYSQGYTTPSTEGIWGNARNISNNTIINPYTSGIIIDSARNDNDFNILVQNNAISSKRNNGYGIQLTANTIHDNVIIINNNILGFSYKYNILNTNNLKLNNVLIYDFIEKNQRNKIFYDVYNRLLGLEMNSNVQEKIPWNNVYFKNTTDNVLDSWKKSNATLTQDVDSNGEKFGKLISSDEYGRLYNDTIQLPTDYYSLICVHLKIKSSETTALSILCKDDSNTTYPTGDGSTYSNYKINIPSTDGYEDLYLTIKAIGLTTLQLWCSEANQEIDVKCFECWKVS